MNKKNTLYCLALLSISPFALANVSLDANRVIYNEKNSEASISITSSGSSAYLVQSWIDDDDNEALKHIKPPFVVTPPLFKLKPGEQSIIKMIYLGSGLATDQESLLWLNVKTIPSVDVKSLAKNGQVVVALKNHIKFFFRPAGLPGNPADAIKNVSWSSSSEKTITAKNDSPYYVIINRVVINGKPQTITLEKKNSTLAPHATLKYTVNSPLPAHSTISWSAIQDSGIVSQLFTKTI